MTNDRPFQWVFKALSEDRPVSLKLPTLRALILEYDMGQDVTFAGVATALGRIVKRPVIYVGSTYNKKRTDETDSVPSEFTFALAAQEKPSA